MAKQVIITELEKHLLNKLLPLCIASAWFDTDEPESFPKGIKTNEQAGEIAQNLLNKLNK